MPRRRRWREPGEMAVVFSMAPYDHVSAPAYGIDSSRIRQPTPIRDAKMLAKYAAIGAGRFYEARYEGLEADGAMLWRAVRRLRVSPSDVVDACDGAEPDDLSSVLGFLETGEWPIEEGPQSAAPVPG